jgi:hypothetical protein
MKLNKKGDWYARDWLVALILFSVVIALFSLVYASSANTYGRSDIVDPNFNEKYDRFVNDTNRVSTSLTATSGGGGFVAIGTAEAIFQSTFTLLQLVLSSLGTFNSQIANIGNDIGVPSVISNYILSALIGCTAIIIIFIIATSVSRNRI